MGDIYIDVKCYGGGQIADAIRDMVALADRLGVSVWCELNGVRTLARPGDDPAATFEAWERELHGKRPYPIASAGRSNP